MLLSIIIPTLNEEHHIEACLQRLRQGAKGILHELIVVDAPGTDATAKLAESAGAKVIKVAKRGRAFQMNAGAAAAKGDLFYFVHADAEPPASFASDILQAVQEGYNLGRFRFRFVSERLLLKMNSWFTRFDKDWVSGGDETLFITRALFEKLNGYDETFVIMEEYDLVRRARMLEPYKVIPKAVNVSARKYDNNTWLRVQIANYKAFRMFKKGIAPEQIRDMYYRHLKHRDTK